MRIDKTEEPVGGLADPDAGGSQRAARRALSVKKPNLPGFSQRPSQSRNQRQSVPLPINAKGLTQLPRPQPFSLPIPEIPAYNSLTWCVVQFRVSSDALWTSPRFVDNQIPQLSKTRQKQRITDSEPDSEVVWRVCVKGEILRISPTRSAESANPLIPSDYTPKK